MKDLFEIEIVEKEQEGTGRYCYYCKSEEGLPRPIGEYIVKLEYYSDNGEDHHLSCQCCRIKRPRFFVKRKECIQKKVPVLKRLGFFSSQN